MGQAAMTGLREWCRAGEKSFALIRQMNAKEYTDSVYHKTGREAARKSEFTLRSSAESHWIKGEKIRDKKESKKLKKGVDTNSELW